MLAPVLITAPAATPVSLTEAKAHCRVDHDDDDALITALIAAAVGHLDGWTGVLGRALVTQKWREQFGGFGAALCALRLALAPVANIESVVYVDFDGQHTLDPARYVVVSEALGCALRPASGWNWPPTARRFDAVTVTYVAGTPAADVPAPIKAAILLIVGHLYQHREAVAENTLATLPFAVDALIAPFRRVGI